MYSCDKESGWHQNCPKIGHYNFYFAFVKYRVVKRWVEIAYVKYISNSWRDGLLVSYLPVRIAWSTLSVVEWIVSIRMSAGTLSPPERKQQVEILKTSIQLISLPLSFSLFFSLTRKYTQTTIMNICNFQKGSKSNWKQKESQNNYFSVELLHVWWGMKSMLTFNKIMIILTWFNG